MTRHSFVTRGLTAGFLAGSTVALYFMFVDLFAAAPLRTPAFLSASLLGLEGMEVALLPIAVYTLLHYAVFLTLGLVLARIANGLAPGAYILLGLAVGIFLFDLLFYGSLIITGVDVVEALGWPIVLLGNLLAGVVLLEYLRFTSPAPEPGWRALIHKHQVLRQGLVAGFLGASMVALSFLIIDLIFRQPLFTPATLGSALLQGAGGPAEVQMDAATILGYTALHLVAFLGVGLAASALLMRAEDHPALLLGIVLLFVTSEALFIGLVTVGGSWVLDAIGWWNVLVGNAVAMLTMVGYLGNKHPALWRLLGKEPLAAPH